LIFKDEEIHRRFTFLGNLFRVHDHESFCAGDHANVLLSQDVTANSCEIFTSGYAALIGGPERTLCIGELWPKRESVFFKKGATVKVQRILQLKGIDTFSTTAKLRITDDGTKKSTTAYIDWPEGLRYLTIGAK
jgi:hypothetical protein